MSVKIFLSTVSDEFHAYRDQLRSDLTRPNVEVKVQEDFIDLGGDTLEKLDVYIEHCDAVVHLVGDMTGSDPGEHASGALRAKYRDLTEKLPPLGEAIFAGAPENATSDEAQPVSGRVRDRGKGGCERMLLSNSVSQLSRRAGSGPKASQFVRSGIARPRRRQWPHGRRRIAITALRSGASWRPRRSLRPPAACSRFRARAEYEVRNDEKGRGPAPRPSSLPRAQSDREVPPRSCRAMPATRNPQSSRPRQTRDRSQRGHGP